MTIASALRNSPYQMNEEQRAIIEHQQGPLLIIAEPGSGKTRSLTLLAMNLMSNDLNKIVADIQKEKFHVQIAPEAEICRSYDIRYLCRQDRVIEIAINK